MRFSDRLARAVRQVGSPLVVGIDPWPERLPGRGGGDLDRAATAELTRRFGLAVVRAAAGQVAAVKPQFAFFEQQGPAGMAALAEVCGAARDHGLLVIGDAKRGDIGTTAAAYAAATLGPDAPFPCDALTVSPFLGPDSLTPFLDAALAGDRGLFVLLRTSNAASARWQSPVVEDLARWIDDENARHGAYGPVGAVVGATHPAEGEALRAAMPHTWFLVPGFGAQGGTAADARRMLRPDGLGALVNSSRGATFPAGPDPAFEADPEAWMRVRIAAVRAELAG
jgi:orotidine-5'-phosphate decarboxylase